MWNSAEGLRDYNNWIGRRPDEIRDVVRGFKNGWLDVFPMNRRFPTWASRVRPYLNITPKQLTQLGAGDRGRVKSRHRMTPNALFDKGAIKGTFSLSGDVYVDEARRPWFEMSTVATIYHFAGKVNWKKKWFYLAGTQKSTPVFKLISPDGTGGSYEVCIHNWQYEGASPKSEIGKVGETVKLHGRTVINEKYQGSYNFGDNGVAGVKAHEHMDIDPHSSKTRFYLIPAKNPRHRWFPKLDNWDNKVTDSRLVFPMYFDDIMAAHEAKMKEMKARQARQAQ